LCEINPNLLVDRDQIGGGDHCDGELRDPLHVVARLQTLEIDKLGFNENYYKFTLILLIKIVLCSKFH